jgi:drug/metabolite transporter (DMT)-like permease
LVIGALVLPMLAGAGFAAIGVAYRMGERRGISAPHILAVVALAGTIVFAMRSNLAAWNVPLAVWVWGVLSGVTQFAAVKLIGPALRRGPLSPLWCAVSLGFVPAVLYAAVVWGERVAGMQMLAVAAGVACVVAASINPKPQAGEARARNAGHFGRILAYGLLLVTIFVVNSTITVAMTDLGKRPGSGAAAYGQRYGAEYLMLLYASLGACILVDNVIGRRGLPGRAVLLLGPLAAVGSIVGLDMQSRCLIWYPPAVVLAVAGVSAIVLVAVLSVIIFKERPTAFWLATIALGVGAVVLANWK